MLAGRLFFSCRVGWSRMHGSAARNEEFLGRQPQSKTKMFCHRGSWLTIHAHPMPWPGHPTASWLLAVTGGLWPIRRKAMWYRCLTIPLTLKIGNSPQLQQVPEANLWCWEVMTGRSPACRIFCLLFLQTLCASQVVPNCRGSLLKGILRLSPVARCHLQTAVWCSAWKHSRIHHLLHVPAASLRLWYYPAVF